MTPTKLLIGQIIVVFAIMIAGLWVAARRAAVMLGYQSEFGAVWFEVSGVPVCRP